MNTTLRQDLEAIASEMTGDRTAAGIATIALNKLVDNDTERAALRAENERLRKFEQSQTLVTTSPNGADPHGYSEETVLLSDVLATENTKLRAENARLSAEVEALRTALEAAGNGVTAIQVDVLDMPLKTANKDCIVIQADEVLSIISQALEK